MAKVEKTYEKIIKGKSDSKDGIPVPEPKGVRTA